MKRLAIATGVYLRARETQINFHIEHGCSGSAVVLAAKSGETAVASRPNLIWGNRRGRFDAVKALLNYPRYSSARVPFGRQRRSIREFLEKHRVEAILSEFGTEAIRLAPVAQEMGLPLFTMLRGADASAYLSKSSHVRAYRLALRNITGVFSVSQALIDNFAQHGLTHPRCFVFPSGVDISAFKPGTKRPGSCLVVGRLIPKKRPDVTIRAFAAARRNAPNSTLEIVGDGPMQGECEEIVAAAGLSECVTFHGAKSHSFVASRMAECKLFLQHSMTAPDGDTEGLPTSIQEAMSAGMVVVSTRHAGIPEAVAEGHTGFLVEEGDVLGFSERIRSCLSGEFPIEQLERSARKMACERFDRTKILNKLEATIEALC